MNSTKLAKTSAVIGFMEFTQCPYCVEFRKTWEILKEKNKFKNIAFVEINKDSLIADVANFNRAYKKRINPPLLTTNVETYPEIFYVINKNIKYYDKTADRSETAMQNLINTVINTNIQRGTNRNTSKYSKKHADRIETAKQNLINTVINANIQRGTTRNTSRYSKKTNKRQKSRKNKSVS